MFTPDKANSDVSSGAQKSLPDKVREWLSSEGYPLEFVTAHTFRDNKFNVRQGRYVHDPNSGTPREVDVLAQETFDLEDSFMRISYPVECKWSRDKPWVILGRQGGKR